MKAIEAAARAILRSEIESYRESDVLLDEHIEWWRNGKSNPESCVHYSSIGIAFRRAEIAFSAGITALAEDDAAVEAVARAICESEYGDPDGFAAITLADTERTTPRWRYCKGSARAAIRAMGGE